MSDDYKAFEQRKADHIKLALMPDNQTSALSQFDRIELIHDALPNINFKDISIHSRRFGKCTPTPFLVSSMTAGHQRAQDINRHLIEACAKQGWAMGVGSQRRELSDPEAAFEWQPLRRSFPNVSLYSNLGLAQLIQTPLKDIQRLTDSLQANALIIHCNPLQECIQPEGTTDYQGGWQALEALTKNIQLPVIIKETGCGFSKANLQRLNDLGIAALDASGLGGTHWGRIEGHRALHDPLRAKAALTFKDWGIDTVSVVKHALALKPKYEVWGSGGVQNGLNAAKLLALGVHTVGFAKPILEAALSSAEKVSEQMQSIEFELKVAMFCTGSLNLQALKQKIAPISG